jgi:acyl-CoA thioesterase FadM
MARVTLSLPEDLPFACELQVRITDLNYANHLANDKVLALMHEARARYFLDLGYGELDADGAAFIMSDVVIVFKSEGFFNQRLRCEVGCADFSRAGFDLCYRFTHLDPKTGAPGKLLAEAKTGMVCYDYSERKVKSIPVQVRAKLGDPNAANLKQDDPQHALPDTPKPESK